MEHLFLLCGFFFSYLGPTSNPFTNLIESSPNFILSKFSLSEFLPDYRVGSRQVSRKHLI